MDVRLPSDVLSDGGVTLRETSSVLALIPARGGSKRVPRKNLREVGGKPLIAWAIEAAWGARSVGRIVVSTDDEEIAAVARAFRADVPFLRPAEIAGDASTDLEVFTHALEWLRHHEGYVPDVCVHVRPTYPLRTAEDIDRVVAILTGTPGIDSVRSVCVATESPFKMWFKGEEDVLMPVVSAGIQEAHSLPWQVLPEVFVQNAAIDAMWTTVITEQRSMAGRNVRAYVMESNHDIDSEADLAAVSRLIGTVRSRQP